MVPLVGKQRAGHIAMSTFHSFGLAILREEAERWVATGAS